MENIKEKLCTGAEFLQVIGFVNTAVSKPTVASAKNFLICHSKKNPNERAQRETGQQINWPKEGITARKSTVNLRGIRADPSEDHINGFENQKMQCHYVKGIGPDEGEEPTGPIHTGKQLCQPAYGIDSQKGQQVEPESAGNYVGRQFNAIALSQNKPHRNDNCQYCRD